MPASPRISIIIPVYNTAAWLERCLACIFSQTFQDWEIVAVDDGSTDNSLAVLKKQARQEARLHVYTQTNHGPAAARKKGLDHAAGQTVLFVDSDDTFPPDYCALLWQAYEQTGAELVLARVYTEGKPEAQTPLFSHARVLKGNEKRLVFDDFSAVMALYGKLIARTLITRIEFPTEVLKNGEDIFPSVQLIGEADKIALVPQARYEYRRRENSQSRRAADAFAGLFDGFLRSRRYLVRRDPALREGFEYVRRVVLTSFIEKYGLTDAAEKLVRAHVPEIAVPRGLFKNRPWKFRLRQWIFALSLRTGFSYSRFMRTLRRLAHRG